MIWRESYRGLGDCSLGARTLEAKLASGQPNLHLRALQLSLPWVSPRFLSVVGLARTSFGLFHLIIVSPDPATTGGS
jgi:hypothetical protein